MWANTIPIDMTAALLCGLSATLAYSRARRLQGAAPVHMRFDFPSAGRANLLVTFDAAEHSGPFAARAVLLAGEGVSLTRDSVDGLPDGEDRLEVVAPMTPAPMSGDNSYRVLGAIGIKGDEGPPRGRVQVEIFDRCGRSLAVEARDF